MVTMSQQGFCCSLFCPGHLEHWAQFWAPWFETTLENAFLCNAL